MAEAQHVLIIEDEPDLAEILSEALIRQGLEVQSTPRVAVALGILKIKKFNAVVLDMKLLDGSGEEVIAELRADKSHLNHATPIAVTSGHLNPEMVTRIGKDIDAAFIKPVQREQLVRKVKQLVCITRT